MPGVLILQETTQAIEPDSYKGKKMQNLKIIAVRDNKGNNFGSLGLSKTLGSAERDFKTLVNTPNSSIHQYPEDFDLYELGEFNDETGKLTVLDSPKHLVKAIQVKDVQP